MTAKYSAEWWEKVTAQPTGERQPPRRSQHFATLPFVHEREPDKAKANPQPDRWQLLLKDAPGSPPLGRFHALISMTKGELAIQLVKIALGAAIGVYFVWWSLEVLHRLPPH